MTVLYAYHRPQDLFEKLKRDAAALRERVDGDRVFNFTVTAWSLKDWITNASYSQDERAEIWNRIPEEKKIYLQACGDIANGFKHFKLDTHAEKKRIVERIVFFPPAVLGKFILGRTMLGSTESLIITTKQGESFDVEEFRENIVQIYTDLLRQVTNQPASL